MTQEGGGDPAGQGGGGGENPPAEPPSGLPSDNQPPANDSVSFEIKPEDLKDGKYQGKWSNPAEMAEHIKNIEDKYANLQRDVTNNSKQTEAEIAATAAELQTKQTQEQTIKDILPDFLNNGMVITPEMETALKETGLTEQDIKLGAYEFKEAIDKNASYVGGKENYDIIMDYHAQNMTDDEKKAFNHSIQNPNNSKALMIGLQVMYEKALSENPEEGGQDRVRGNPAQNNSIKPYESKAELMRDKKYADSRVASSADKARYRQRLAVTPEKVWR